MATGALDANGIWQYGEDDSEPTFSGLLNKLAGSTSTTVTRLETLTGLNSSQLATAQDNLRIGYVNISPSTVAQSGGSASANAQGLVTFTGCTSISLNSVFSSTYKHYEITFGSMVTSLGGIVNFRFRNAGADRTGNFYSRAGILAFSSSTALNAWNADNQNTAALWQNDWYSNATMDVFTNTANNNRFITRIQSNGAGNRMSVVTGHYSDPQVIDGFTIYPSTGTLTGFIQVKALNE